MATAIKLYNTRTRALTTFEPLAPGRVSIYSCGPTVYNFAHIGNLRAYVFVDTLKRALQWCGYQTHHVMNITDVGHLTDDASDGEDKMELAARRMGRDIWDLSRFYTSAFFDHCGDLGIQPPNIACRATDHIGEQIALVARIEKAGFAYRAADGIYLDTSLLPHYADFAKLDLEGQRDGARVEVVAGKRNAADFALWKFAAGGTRLMEWDSPWGRGFPGWHLECSAMSCHYLGERFDIHTGGIDHIPVHHTNEIAQMQAATGAADWVNVWMHNNFLVLEKEDEEDGDKMSKSAGNFLTLDTLRAWGLQPLAYRFFLLNAHYRKEARFSRPNLEQAATGLQNLWRAVRELRQAADKSGALQAPALAPHREELSAAVTDDLNTAKALAAVWGVIKAEKIAAADRLAFIEDADRVLGLRLLAGPCGKASGGVKSDRIDAIIEKRKAARAHKDFAVADTIRDVCDALGVKLMDGPEGTTWKLEE